MRRFSLILLVRHGETATNRDHRIRGWSNPPLTPKGYVQATKVAKILEGCGVECIYTSDLKRASDTAHIISKALGVKVKVDSSLRPWNMGELTGAKAKDVEEEIHYYIKNRTKQIPSGESFDTFSKRCMRAVDEYEKRKEIIAVVASQSNILTMLARGKPKVVEDHEPPPGSVTMFK
jgi:probable phosphoglycerate mutase